MEIIEAETDFLRVSKLLKQLFAVLKFLFFDHNVQHSNIDKNTCEGELTLSELAKVYKCMDNGKSLGFDGFSV